MGVPRTVACLHEPGNPQQPEKALDGDTQTLAAWVGIRPANKEKVQPRAVRLGTLPSLLPSQTRCPRNLHYLRLKKSIGLSGLFSPSLEESAEVKWELTGRGGGAVGGMKASALMPPPPISPPAL